jgi:hypothetical protein
VFRSERVNIFVSVPQFIFIFGLKTSMCRPVPVSLYLIYGLEFSFSLLASIKF